MSSEASTSKQPEKDSSSVYNEYMKQLKQWAHEKDCYYWMWHQYLTMQTQALHMHMMNQVQSTNQSQNPPQQQRQPPPQNNIQHQEYTLPSILRRSFAEIFDCLLLIIIKTIGLLLVIKISGLESSFSTHAEEIVGVRLLKLLQEDVTVDDLDDIFRDLFTDQDLKAMENELSLLLSVTILYRFLTGIYEWLFIWLYGATPGKYIFGLKVVSCLSANRIRPHVVMMNTASSVSCASSFIRALLKNLMISLMIPGFLTAFFHPCKRTTYDELSRTIVVNRNVINRPRAAQGR